MRAGVGSMVHVDAKVAGTHTLTLYVNITSVVTGGKPR